VRSLDPSCSRKEAELIFSEIDQDKDGYIDFGEFARYLDFPQP
jgi:Ca2+-binding EF-hand superfamily protein